MRLKHVGIFFAVVGLLAFVGMHAYRYSQQWTVEGRGSIISVTGDNDSFVILVNNISDADQFVRIDLFGGIDPEVAEEELPPSMSIAGRIEENGVNYHVIPADGGKLLLHSYVQETEDGAYGADIIEFRPSAMRLSDILKQSSLPKIPDAIEPSWVSIESKGSRDRYFIEMNQDLVHRFVWERSWP